MAKQKHLTLATANLHKVRELTSALEGCGWGVSPAPPETADVPETGETFQENARLKALAVARAVGGVAMADDSGLVVDALGGEPGVHSRRWAGPDATDADRINRLLDALKGVPAERRTARFVCAACVASPDGILWEGAGTVEGLITEAPRGENGFGYDPVFEIPEIGRTMAQLTQDQKNAISHRGRAMSAACAWLGTQGGVLDT